MLTLEDITLINRPLTMDECCTCVYDFCPDEYARGYAEAWIDRSVHSRAIEYGIPAEAHTQALYVLGNMTRWRGPMASRVRNDLKRIAKAGMRSETL